MGKNLLGVSNKTEAVHLRLEDKTRIYSETFTKN
jgi:hypothetical protein